MASLCSVCESITPQALAQPDGYCHIESAHDLIHSAKVCDFCSLIRRAMDQDCRTPKTHDQIRTNTKPEPLYLLEVGDGLDTAEDVCGDGIERSEQPKLFGINVHIPDIEYEYDLVKFSLFSELGTAPSRNKDVVGMRLLTNSGSNEAFGLVEGWYNTCKNNHTECNKTLTGTVGSLTKSFEPPLLPTGVLDVGPADGSREPKLLVTNGTHASYAALSHCWGKHRILTTTSHNLGRHCIAINFSNLPKTFQDAIKIVRFLGLRYLWIDSLCIVQDDADDWRKESVQMGRIYKDAEITVAASGARHGSEGFFVPRPPLPPVVRLPYGEPSQGEYMSATLFPDSMDTTVSETPLGSRAWITQEWMLSPRVIHHTKARMVWACRTLLKCEDGENEASWDEQRLFESARRYRQDKHSQQRGDSDVDDEEIMAFYADWCDLVSTYACTRPNESEARRDRDPSTRTGDDYYFMEFYPKESITYGGFVTQNTIFISGRDMAPAAWVVFDSNEWPAKPYYLAMISANELEGKPDGFNVMFLAEVKPDPGLGSDRRFERLGVGQIIDQAWFDHAELATITLV
ncbi:heterokaryon incompatibility protein [Colletotrichum salicis]|uniref:Heterokaryon incompatibility protein n=1 Tax=Colletotrichum salicis TaxID=1209931 RepID=A0A135UPM9_9PEZI|nr:heterokaryon incompatibility protein [Colletotrichum salicis]